MEMAKSSQRTEKQQEYRDNLAHDLKRLRSYGNTGRQLAKALLEDQKKSGEYRKGFGKLDGETALQLIEKGEVKYVAENIRRFRNLDEKVATKLIENGYGGLVVMNHDLFAGFLLNKATADKLIDFNRGNFVLLYWDHFEGVDKNQFINRMVERGDGGYIVEYRKYIDMFSPEFRRDSNYLKEFYDGLVFDQNFAEKLINIPCPNRIYHNELILIQGLKYFEGLNYKKIALDLINKGRGSEVALYIGNFNNLDKEVDERLSEYNYKYHYREHPRYKEIFGYDS